MTEPQNVALYNIEVEQALLGAVLVSGGSAIDMVDGIVTPDDFSEGLHVRLFDQFTKARNDGRSIDVALARAALGNLSEIQVGPGVGAPEYVARLAAAACGAINSADYAKTIRECADRRRIASLARSITDGCAGGISPAEMATAAIDELDTIASTQPGKRKAQFSIVAAADQAIERMQWGMQNPGKLSGISWGLSDLDAKTGGLQRGELIVMAGRPGMGKSGLMVSCVRQSAKAGSNALIFSHEMTAQAVADRALSDSCFDDGPLAYHDISRGYVSNDAAERIVLAAREFKGLSIKIDEQPALTVSQIVARARKHKLALERKGRTLDLVAVDHMHLTRASERYSGNRVNEITEISGGLKALAKELNVPVLALAQLSRAVETRDDKRPMLSDLRDSGAIEQDADLIVFVYREAYYLERATSPDPVKEDQRITRLGEVANRLEAIIAKQRNGPVCTVPLFFNAASNAARSLARAA